MNILPPLLSLSLLFCSKLRKLYVLSAPLLNSGSSPSRSPATPLVAWGLFVISCLLLSACYSTHRSPSTHSVACIFCPLLSAPAVRIPDLRCLSANSSSPRISHSRAVFTTPCHGAICDSELLLVVSSHILPSPIVRPQHSPQLLPRCTCCSSTLLTQTQALTHPELQPQGQHQSSPSVR